MPILAGSLGLADESEQAVWLWREGLGWVWTHPNHYPFMYSNQLGGWIFFHGGAGKHLLFYDCYQPMACYRQVGMSAVKTLNFFFSKQRTVPLLVALLLPNLTNGNSGYHSLFLKNDGSLHAMGSNAWGEFELE